MSDRTGILPTDKLCSIGHCKAPAADPVRVSVIIPTFNRATYVISVVRQLLEQSFQDFEVIVVDQSVQDAAQKLQSGLAELADPRIRYVHLNTPGSANARNEGISRSAGSLVLFLDDDVILLGRDFLNAHVDRFSDPRVGAVAGRIIERVNKRNTTRTRASVSLGGRTLDNMSGTRRVAVRGLKGGNTSFRAGLFEQIGGFDRNYTGTALLEDADFSEQVRAAGWDLVFEPTAELVHLSAPAGGNRVTSAQEREWWRFRCTAYYIRKHRGRAGLVPFAATFGLIGLKRAIQWRDPGLVRYLMTAVRAGLRAHRAGADQTLPTNL